MTVFRDMLIFLYALHNSHEWSSCFEVLKNHNITPTFFIKYSAKLIYVRNQVIISIKTDNWSSTRLLYIFKEFFFILLPVQTNGRKDAKLVTSHITIYILICVFKTWSVVFCREKENLFKQRYAKPPKCEGEHHHHKGVLRAEQNILNTYTKMIRSQN